MRGEILAAEEIKKHQKISSFGGIWMLQNF